MALERACAQRGWPLASSPADADVLAVCGSPGPELAEVVSRLWEQLPGPRARLEVTAAGDVPSALDTAAEQLLDLDRQRADAESRSVEPGREGMDHGGMDHKGMDHGGMDHEGMDHGDMDMAPGGIPLAEGGEDRDGLEMDVLHVSLGPVLPCWPAGLVLECSLQGDVIVDVSARLVDGTVARHPDAGNRSGQTDPGIAAAALACDQAARVLALVGWPDRTAQLLRLRDELLDAAGAPARSAGETRRRLTAHVDETRDALARSRLLRWSLRRLGVVDAARLEERGLPPHLRGDARDRLLALLDRAAAALRPDADTVPAPTAPAAAALPAAAIGDLVTGLDLATARLVVASLGIEAAGITAPEAAHA